MRFGFLRRDILNKDVPRQEPRRHFGGAIVKKLSLSYVSNLSPSFNRLPHGGFDGDTRIGHAGSTQKQTFGIRPFHSFGQKFNPNLGSSASHVDDQESLRALQESADPLPNHHLKSAIRGVSALWQIAKNVEQSKKEAQAWSEHSLKVLESLAEAVGHDPFNIPPLMLRDIRSFEELLFEIRTTMEPPMEQVQASRRFRSNRHGNGTNDFDKRLSELQQKFEETCSQRSCFDTPFVSVSESTGALRVPPDPSHTLELRPLRRRFPLFAWKSRLDSVSSACADVASTTLNALEKPAGSAVPILSAAVSGISALLDIVKRVKQSKQRAQALSRHSATLVDAVDHDQSNMPPPMLESVLSYRDQLSEARAAMVPITERSWISRLFRLNRNEDILDTFNQRLNEAQQRFMVGTTTQIRGEVSQVSQLQKHTVDSLLTEYSKSPPLDFNRLILIPDYSSGYIVQSGGCSTRMI